MTDAVREALELLCDELELSLPDSPQEFNAENIWRARRQARDALASGGWRDGIEQRAYEIAARHAEPHRVQALANEIRDLALSTPPAPEQS